MNVFTRRATVDDIAAIQHIAALTWPHAYASVLSPKQVSYMLKNMYSTAVLAQQMEKEGHIFLLSFADDIPVGFAGFSETAPSIWKLHKLYVLPFQQKGGLGKSLLQQAEQYAFERGGTAILLNVNRNNAALDFYRHVGFVIDAEGDFPIGKGFFMNDYIMKKNLV